MKKNIPNILTVSRIIGIPFIVILMLINTPTLNIWAFALFVVISFTDFLDGYLSRKWNVVSNLGRFLDPVADKLLVVAVIITLMINGTLSTNSTVFGSVFGTIGGICGMLILFREITISSLREYLSEHKIIVHVSPLAKWKTATQLIALGILILGGNTYSLIGYIFLIISTVLTVVTGYQYIKKSLFQF